MSNLLFRMQTLVVCFSHLSSVASLLRFLHDTYTNTHVHTQCHRATWGVSIVWVPPHTQECGPRMCVRVEKWMRKPQQSSNLLILSLDWRLYEETYCWHSFCSLVYLWIVVGCNVGSYLVLGGFLFQVMMSEFSWGWLCWMYLGKLCRLYIPLYQKPYYKHGPGSTLMMCTEEDINQIGFPPLSFLLKLPLNMSSVALW